MFSHASLACKCFTEMIHTTTTTGQLSSIDFAGLPPARKNDCQGLFDSLVIRSDLYRMSDCTCTECASLWYFLWPSRTSRLSLAFAVGWERMKGTSSGLADSWSTGTSTRPTDLPRGFPLEAAFIPDAAEAAAVSKMIPSKGGAPMVTIVPAQSHCSSLVGGSNHQQPD